MKDGDRLPVCLAFKSNDDGIWITRTHVEVSDKMADDEKVPRLSVDLSENSREKTKG